MLLFWTKKKSPNAQNEIRWCCEHGSKQDIEIVRNSSVLYPINIISLFCSTIWFFIFAICTKRLSTNAKLNIDNNNKKTSNRPWTAVIYYILFSFFLLYAFFLICQNVSGIYENASVSLVLTNKFGDICYCLSKNFTFFPMYASMIAKYSIEQYAVNSIKLLHQRCKSGELTFLQFFFSKNLYQKYITAQTYANTTVHAAVSNTYVFASKIQNVFQWSAQLLRRMHAGELTKWFAIILDWFIGVTKTYYCMTISGFDTIFDRSMCLPCRGIISKVHDSRIFSIETILFNLSQKRLILALLRASRSLKFSIFLQFSLFQTFFLIFQFSEKILWIPLKNDFLRP